MVYGKVKMNSALPQLAPYSVPAGFCVAKDKRPHGLLVSVVAL
jgi:hypothetical protein